MAQNIQNIEIFSVGTWNNMKFVSSDLQEIVGNTSALLQSGRLKAPLKLGHSSNQILEGQDDGDPAMGWIENLRVEENKIVSDFVNVPEILVNAFKQGLYRQVSVEMRHIEHMGWAITAVALLGADIPAVKNLNDLSKFLSESIPSLDENLKLAACFSASPPTILFKKRNMEENSLELEELRAKLKAQELTINSYKQKEVISKFCEAKQKILSSYQESVKKGLLSPATFSKIESAIEAQRGSYVEGAQISIPAEVIAEIFSEIQTPITGEHAVKMNDESQSKLGDEILVDEIHKRMTLTGEDYLKASQFVYSTNKSAMKAYKAFTINASGI